MLSTHLSGSNNIFLVFRDTEQALAERYFSFLVMHAKAFGRGKNKRPRVRDLHGILIQSGYPAIEPSW